MPLHRFQDTSHRCRDYEERVRSCESIARWASDVSAVSCNTQVSQDSNPFELTENINCMDNRKCSFAEVA